jgi:hypothetical protein
MSFSLGVYELFSYILPGLIYLYTINEFFKLFGLQYIKYSDLSGATSIFGIGAIAFFLGFLFHQFLAKLWFEDHGREPKRIEEYTKLTQEKFSIEFTYQDLNFLYSVLIQRTGDNIRNHVDRLRAYNLMLRNIVGNSILLVALQITVVIKNGFAIENLFLILLFILIGIFVFRRQEDMLVHSARFIFYHAYAYGNNLETFLSNDQPRWDYSQIHQTNNQKEKE